MILSNVEIHRALDEGRLRIDPEPWPRFPTETEECPYQTSAVDLRLGNEILVPRELRPFNIDLRKGRFADLVTVENYERLTIRANQPFSLEPGQFVLAKTLERVTLSIPEGAIPEGAIPEGAIPEGAIPEGSGAKRVLAARIEGRSSFARCGMLVHFTAPTIHAGFSGTIALEMINLARTTIVLYPGVRVCQLILEEVKGTPFRNESQFHGQTSPAGTRA